MTPSSSSSRKLPRLVLIHGLNNRADSFRTLAAELGARGFECVLLTLPGQAELREETKDLKAARQKFGADLRELAQDPFVVVAFSTGALYLQLWLDQEDVPLPVAQVLLAPAFAIRSSWAARHLLSRLPDWLIVPSLTPARFRRYNGLRSWEYRTLFGLMDACEGLTGGFRVPTLLVVDPQDEIVDAQSVVASARALNDAELCVYEVRRPDLRKAIGQHHILFHPDYFTEAQWRGFLNELTEFVRFHTDAD